MSKAKKYCCTTAEAKEDCHCACDKVEKEYLAEIAKLDAVVEALKPIIAEYKRPSISSQDMGTSIRLKRWDVLQDAFRALGCKEKK